MTLTVEDGTGKTDANAFVSLDAFKAYCDTRGTDYSAYEDAALEQAIVRATDYLSDGFSWKGYKVKPRGATGGEQALAWPRYNATDRNGYGVDSDSIPWEVEQAASVVAIAEMASPGIMSPTYTASERVKREKVGPLETEYHVSDTSPQSARPVQLRVRDLVGGLIDTTGGSRLVGEAYRG